MEPWEKVLYKNQKYPDNYTDKHTFLRDLKTNIDFKEVTCKEAFLGGNLLVQEICTVVGFALVYVYLFNEWIEPNMIFFSFNCLTFIGFLLHKFNSKSAFFNTITDDLSTVLIYVVFGHLFSPVLYTLTDTISTDTIYTMTVVMLIVHLIFFDYGVSAAIVSNSLSLSAAIFASICLASRLSSAHHAFILITIAIEFFVLFPHLRTSPTFSLPITLVLAICVMYFLWLLSGFVMIIFLITILFVNVVCPLMFVCYQKYRNNIYGPWDEAVVEDADSVLSL